MFGYIIHTHTDSKSHDDKWEEHMLTKYLENIQYVENGEGKLKFRSIWM